MHLCNSPIAFLIAVFFLAAQPAGGTNNEGRALYLTHCANCHGEGGEGFLQVYPPLVDSRYFDHDLSRLPCVIRYGMKGTIQVGAKTFNGIMPENPRLSVENIEALAEYLADRWGKGRRVEDIPSLLESCGNKRKGD